MKISASLGKKMMDDEFANNTAADIRVVPNQQELMVSVSSM